MFMTWIWINFLERIQDPDCIRIKCILGSDLDISKRTNGGVQFDFKKMIPGKKRQVC